MRGAFPVCSLIVELMRAARSRASASSFRRDSWMFDNGIAAANCRTAA
jgi:hypothetical protein